MRIYTDKEVRDAFWEAGIPEAFYDQFVDALRLSIPRDIEKFLSEIEALTEGMEDEGLSVVEERMVSSEFI